MQKLAKKDLHLMGSAGSLETLKKLIIEKLYWGSVEVTKSPVFESRLGECYSVANGTGVKTDMVIICGKNGRWSLYRIQI